MARRTDPAAAARAADAARRRRDCVVAARRSRSPRRSLVGIAIGWSGREACSCGQGTPTTFAHEAAFSHAIYARDQGRPVEVGAQDGARLVRWLTRRLGVEVAPPDLSEVGFALVGGRLVAGNEKPTALLMYENADKQRLTLQWRKNDPKARAKWAFRYASRTASASSTGSTNCAYALSGNVDRARLLARRERRGRPARRAGYAGASAAEVAPTAGVVAHRASHR